MNLLLLLQMQVPTQPGRTDVTGKSLLFFIAVVGTIALIYYVFKRAPGVQGEEKTRLMYLYERKDQIFENLRDLNFEYKAGKLSDADFFSMRDSMEQEAANFLAEIEELERQAGGPEEAHA